jgi:hypothetical protein
LRWTVAAVAVSGVVGWGALTPRADDIVAAHVPVRAPNLAPLLPYAVPVPDSIAGANHGGADAAVRDPFGAPDVVPVKRETPPQREPAPAAPRWTLSATMVTGSRRAAIIDDVLVYVGDTIAGGGRLIGVERDRVTITDAKGASHVLMVKEGE